MGTDKRDIPFQCRNYRQALRGGITIREYTTKEMKALKANPYTFKVTKHRLYFTAAFKEAFWNGYQAGNTPRKMLSDLGYDLEVFGQKQIDSIVQHIKREASSGHGFTEGNQRTRRPGMGDNGKSDKPVVCDIVQPADRIWNELRYLRQEVEFIKKFSKENRTGVGRTHEHEQ